jgi:hypothetical protein
MTQQSMTTREQLDLFTAWKSLLLEDFQRARPSKADRLELALVRAEIKELRQRQSRKRVRH